METTHEVDDTRPTVDEAVNAVAAEIEPVAKSEKAGSGGYSYRGIDKILDALAPIMARHQVTVVPYQVTDVRHEWVPSPSRSNPDRVEGFTSGTYTFQVRGPRGAADAYTGQYHAQGMNDRDKSPGSMASYAYRNFVSLLFRIPTAQSDAEARDEHPVTTEPAVTDHQLSKLMQLFEALPAGDRTDAKYEFLQQFEISRPDQLPKSRYDEAVKLITARLPEPWDTDTPAEPATDDDDSDQTEKPEQTSTEIDPATGLTDREAEVLEALDALGSGNVADIAEFLGRKSVSAQLRTLIAALAERELIELDPDVEQGRGPARIYRSNDAAIAALAEQHTNETETTS